MRDPALWSALHQLIYDEVIGSVLKIIRRLNLSATTSFASEEVFCALCSVGLVSKRAVVHRFSCLPLNCAPKVMFMSQWC